jgi:hypothetical protein
MSTMIAALYDALKEAGASEEKARLAAKALAEYEQQFRRIETDLVILKWMAGFNLAFSVSILLKLLV